jgi:hypothetical protein
MFVRNVGLSPNCTWLQHIFVVIDTRTSNPILNVSAALNIMLILINLNDSKMFKSQCWHRRRVLIVDQETVFNVERDHTNFPGPTPVVHSLSLLDRKLNIDFMLQPFYYSTFYTHTAETLLKVEQFYFLGCSAV